MKSFLPKYDAEYAQHLSPAIDCRKRGLVNNVYQRAQGFRRIFDLLEQKNQQSYLIVETGTLRQPGDWKAGQSSMLFEQFVKFHGGRVKSVDIDARACEAAKGALDAEFTTVNLGDSVEFLNNNDWSSVDLFYLDSYDVKWGAPLPSAEHHLKEFRAIEKYMKPGVVLAIDDNSFLLDSNQRTGKGMLVYQYLFDQGIVPLYDDYQIIYKF
jgi:hypothetical protein